MCQRKPEETVTKYEGRKKLLIESWLCSAVQSSLSTNSLSATRSTRSVVSYIEVVTTPKTLGCLHNLPSCMNALNSIAWKGKALFRLNKVWPGVHLYRFDDHLLTFLHIIRGGEKMTEYAVIPASVEDVPFVLAVVILQCCGLQRHVYIVC